MRQEEEDILRYLTDQMDEAERLRFEDRLSVEEALSESVEHDRRIMNVVDVQTQEFKEELNSVIISKRKSRLIRRYWMAASISLIVLTSILIFKLQQSSPLDLAISYQEPYPDVITSRSVSGTIDMSAYNDGRYLEAISEFESALKENDDDLIRLYLAVSFLMLDQNEKAFKILDKTKLKRSEYQADFYWYQSLALIKSRHNNEAEVLLEKLKEGSPFYEEKCKDLLRAIE